MSENLTFNNTHSSKDEIDLYQLFKVIWNGKLIILSVSALAASIAILIALTMSNIYKSEALLIPASKGDAGSLSAKFGGIASIAGVNLGSDPSVDKAKLAIEVIKSRKFLMTFIKKRELLVPLLAAKGWNKSDDALIIDSKIYDIESNKWVRKADSSGTSIPTYFEAYEIFLEILSISRDVETGLITLAIEFISPTLAEQWVNWLVTDLNDAIRIQDVAEAQRSIDYLKEQIASTTLSELQTQFFELIQKQTETIMLAKASPEYVFRIVDPAVVPEKKYKPQRALICLFGTMLGFIIGVLIVLIRDYLRKNTNKVYQ